MVINMLGPQNQMLLRISLQLLLSQSCSGLVFECSSQLAKGYLNPDIKEVILMRKATAFNKIVLPTINSVQLSLKDRGSHMDLVCCWRNRCTWHIFSQIHPVTKLDPYLQRPDLIMTILASVILRLQYHVMINTELPSKMIQKLELIQNVAAHLLPGTSWWDHVAVILRSLL